MSDIRRPNNTALGVLFTISVLFLPAGVTGYVVVFGGELPLGGVCVAMPIGAFAAFFAGVMGYGYWKSHMMHELGVLTLLLWIINLVPILLGWLVNYLY